jgi:hypothetical protein
LDFVQRSPFELGRDAGKADQRPISLIANQTTSFLVSGFGSGAYSTKLLNGTKQQFSGFSQLRQCGEELVGFVAGFRSALRLP